MSANHGLDTSLPAYGVAILWLAIAATIAGFVLDGVVSYVLLLGFIPVIYGTHEALHETLIPDRGKLATLRHVHNDILLVLGFALQLMNFRLLRPAHMRHHVHGRAEEGYAPDIAVGRPGVVGRVHYYLTLLGLPALSWQLAGFARLVVPAKWLPFENEIRFEIEKSRVPFWVAQVAVASAAVGLLLVGGLTKFLIYEAVLCFVWSVLQNVSHYGLIGIDEATDRVCARSYDLGLPWRLLTFGSTMHLAHHVNMRIPGLRLHEPAVQEAIEARLGVRFVVSHGLWPFLRDVARQFRGPVPEERLSGDWIVEDLRSRPIRLGHGGYRKGFVRQSTV